jgi:hypothetical protein
LSTRGCRVLLFRNTGAECNMHIQVPAEGVSSLREVDLLDLVPAAMLGKDTGFRKFSDSCHDEHVDELLLYGFRG